MKTKLYLFILLECVVLFNAITFADEKSWQLIELISQADIVAIVNVDQSRGIDAGFLQIDLSVNKILKGMDKDVSSLILRHPLQNEAVRFEHEPIRFANNARYLVFLQFEKSNLGSQILRLISPTSGAVRLEGDKIFRKPALLDGYPPQYRRFNEHHLLQRIQELIVEGPCWPPAPERAKQLQEKGFPADTMRQVIKAIKSENADIRCIALGLYAQRAGQNEATSKLQEALSDPKVKVRWHAAHWLGRLGSKNGLKQMQQDFKKITTGNTGLMLSEPNTVKEPMIVKQHKDPQQHNLEEALDVARVLAELGDRQGYKLAARMALEGTLPEQRYRAVTVLVEMAKTNKSLLEAEGLKPVSILCTIAKFERDVDVFYKLVNLVAEIWKWKNLDDDIALQILEFAKDSINQSEKTRGIARLYFNQIKAKMKSTEDKNDFR